MRNFIQTTATICLLLINNLLSAQTEEPKLKPHFFTLRNSKASLGINIEGSPAFSMLSMSKPSGIDVLYKDPRSDKTLPPYAAIGLNIDLYSDNSLVGLLFGGNWSVLDQTFQSGDTASDYFDMTRLEIPVYIKFRPGFYNDTSHFWIMFGGAYSKALTCKREHFSPSTSSFAQYTDVSNTQINSVFLLSVSTGFEFYLSRTMRGAAFISGYYPLTSYINQNYSDFKTGGKSILAHYPNFEIKDLRFAAGLKILFSFKKEKES